MRTRTSYRRLVLGIVLLTAATLRSEQLVSAESGHVLEITVRGEVLEADPPFQLFGNLNGTNLRKTIAVIDDAIEDDKVSGLLLRLKNPLSGMSQRQALRRALLRFRRGGKPSYCHVDDISGARYVLASACSEVSLLPTAHLELTGLSMEFLYMKGLFDRLGIKFQELRMGRYKSAVEGLTRDGPSEATSEQMNSLLDALYRDFVGAIAENRGLRLQLVRELIDQGFFHAEEARQAGLVDHVEYEDTFLARIRGKGEKSRRIVKARVGKQLNLDLTGFAGMMNLMNEILGGGSKRRSSSRPKLAIVYAVGPITQAPVEDQLFGAPMVTADETVEVLRGLRNDDTVKAIVLRVDSPGGSATASERIWREVQETKRVKPVVVSMGNLAASGGYYISCGASWIVAENSTLTGSIGVIGALPDMRELANTVGVRVERFYRGRRANMISPYFELSDDGREVLMGYLRKVYEQFLDRVSRGRGLPDDVVARIAEGRVWSGGQALRHGLIDELGGLEDAVVRARELGNVPADAEVTVLPKPKDLIDLLQGPGVRASPLRLVVEQLPVEIQRAMRQMAWLQLLPTERIFLALPTPIRVITR